MSQAAYSDLKAAWHLDRIAAIREGSQVAPVELQFILSDLCNQDCFFCAYRSEIGLSQEQFVEHKDGKRIHNPNRMIPKAKALEILNDAASMGVKSVIFTGGGEPTVHPHHMELFEHALKLGLKCSLNTNGIVLRKGWEDVLPRFTYVRVSVDAGSAEDYARVRRVKPESYQKALDHLTQMAELCGANGCLVGTGFVVTPDNYENLVEGVRNIRRTGASYVRLASMQSTEGLAPYGDNVELVRDHILAAMEEETETFKVVNLFDVAMGKVAAGPFCGMQQFVLYIGANLKVYRCCYTAYTELGEIGSLAEQSFYEWFHSEQKKRAIDEFDARDCGICPLEHKNATIRYMIDPAPTHVEFV